MLLRVKRSLPKWQVLFHPGYPFGSKVRIAVDKANQVIVFCGSMGSGKSLQISGMVRVDLMQTVAGSNQRILVYDATSDLKGALLTQAACPVHFLNVTERGASAIDLACVRSQTDARVLSEILIPDVKTSEPYFTEAPRVVLQCCLEFLLAHVPENRSWCDVVRLCQDINRLIQAVQPYESIRNKLEAVLAEDKTKASLVSSILVKTGYLELIAAFYEKAERTITPKEFIEGECIVHMGVSALAGDALKRLYEFFINRCFQRLLDSSARFDKASTHIYLDEFPGLAGLFQSGEGQAESIALRLIREQRKLGVKTVLGFQNPAQLQRIFGHSGANALLGLSTYACFLRQEDAASQKFASDFFGTYEVADNNLAAEGEGWFSKVRRSESTRTVPRVAPELFGMLPIPNRSTGHGIGAYYKAQGYMYRDGYTSRQISRQLVIPTNPTIQTYQPIDPAEVRLPPLSEPDLQRLGLL